MKNTKDNVLKLLKQLKVNKMEMYDISCENKDNESITYYRIQYCQLQEFIWLLTDNEYFDAIWSMYNKEK